MSDLIESLLMALGDGQGVIHCQVVETRGSTPQKAGARMLVSPDGGQVGTLGGGCVEAEVKQKAIRLLDRPDDDARELHTFILDHDYAWADGLICGGRMAILAEVLRRESALAYVRELERLSEHGGFTERIAIDPEKTGLPLGARRLDSGVAMPDIPWPGILPEAEPLANRPRASVRSGVAYLPTLPRINLLIIGAGHVGQAVAELAARCDFDVTVADDRAQYANPGRFPAAKAFSVGPMAQILPALQVDANTYVLIVTRGHGHDQESLDHMARTPAAYVGLIGSRRKIRMIFEALREQGVPDERLDRVAAPVGIEIGSETVEEIAISIVAELIAVRNLNRPPASVASGVAWR